MPIPKTGQVQPHSQSHRPGPAVNGSANVFKSTNFRTGHQHSQLCGSVGAGGDLCAPCPCSQAPGCQHLELGWCRERDRDGASIHTAGGSAVQAVMGQAVSPSPRQSPIQQLFNYYRGAERSADPQRKLSTCTAITLHLCPLPLLTLPRSRQGAVQEWCMGTGGSPQ